MHNTIEWHHPYNKSVILQGGWGARNSGIWARLELILITFEEMENYLIIHNCISKKCSQPWRQDNQTSPCPE